ncbi:universal stress protein [Natrinema halophilum]|uniref:Universal stress protein n=1 Tax=Natrinema halophilum TaxID=1699371 RepID=A0A7D5GGT0_9EURY|nr:universal stress protein [Natrinema halophilum]QLG48527.1 universal stress protein [Natrinema halophilum]
MVRKTVVAVDGSPQASAALAYALEEFPESSITALHVVRLPEGYWTSFTDSETELPGYENAQESARELLESAEQTAAESDRELETVVETGKPAREIVDYAVENGFDQIVIGSHGRTGVDRVLLGSVSEQVVRRAPMTVAVVHEQADR